MSKQTLAWQCYKELQQRMLKSHARDQVSAPAYSCTFLFFREDEQISAQRAGGRTGVYEKGSVVGRREVWVPSSCKQVTSLRQPDAVYVWTAKKQKVPLRATNTSVATHMPFIHDHDLWVSGAEMTSFLYQGPDDENPFNGTGHDLPLLSGSKQYNTKHMDFSQSLLSQNLIPHSTSLEQILLLSTC